MEPKAEQIFDTLSTTINIEREPFILNVKDLTKVLCRLLIKNLDIFMRLYFYQLKDIFSSSNKLMFYTSDAGDIYQSFRMRFAETKNTSVRVILLDNDFNRLALSFSEEIKSFSNLAMFADQYENISEKMWEACKYLIIPVRINPTTIPVEERERILRLWLSTAFTLPLLDAYNDKYAQVYQKSISVLRNLYKALKINSKEAEDAPSFNIAKINELGSIPVNLMDLYVSPIKPGGGKLDKTFRTYMYIVLLSSIEIIRKPCPNLRECKSVNPNFQGDCLSLFDDYVNAQIKKIQEVTKILTPAD